MKSKQFFKYKKLGKDTWINIANINVACIESTHEGKVKLKSDNGIIEIVLETRELTRLIAILEGDI